MCVTVKFRNSCSSIEPNSYHQFFIQKIFFIIFDCYIFIEIYFLIKYMAIKICFNSSVLQIGLQNKLIGLKSKIYSLINEDNNGCKRVKGNGKYVAATMCSETHSLQINFITSRHVTLIKFSCHVFVIKVIFFEMRLIVWYFITQGSV